MKKSAPVAATPAAAPQPRRSSSARAKPAETHAAAAAPGNGEHRDETLRRIAYGFYEARGCIDGHAIEGWLQAQAQLDQSSSTRPAT